MEEFLTSFFRADYMPHGHCYLWQPGILWINVISDLLIATAYFSIPIALLIFVKKKKNLEFQGIFILFAAFILCCGITHLFSIYTIWNGTYGLHGIAKAITALVSIMTAYVLFNSIKAMLEIPTPTELEEALEKAAQERVQRTQLELKRRSDAIFKFSLELLPTGLLVIDANQRIRIANKALESMFGYKEDELIGKDLTELLTTDQSQPHEALVNKYLSHPDQRHSMASGRLVQGQTKSGDAINVEVSLSVHDFEGEKHAFASVVNVSEVIEEKTLFFEASHRLQRAIDATNEGIWEWNVQTNNVWYSPRLMTIIGKDPQNDKPKLEHWLNHIHPEDKNYVSQALDRHFEKKGKYEVVYRGLTKDKSYQWMHARGDTIFDDQNTPILMSGTLANINEVKMLEMQLADKNRFLDAVLNKSLSGMYIFDLKEFKNVFVNAQYQKITGYTLEDLKRIQKDEDLMQLFHPDDVDEVNAHIKRVLESQSNEAFSIEYRFMHKAGHWIWCLSRDSVYKTDTDGLPKEMLGTFVDISELKARENRIEELAKDFLTTFDQAAVGIAHVGLDGAWLKVNNKLCEIVGYSREALLMTDFQTITHEEDLNLDLQHVQELIEGQADNYSMEKRYIHKNGQIIWVLLTVAIVRNEDGSNSHFISVVEDISERKALEHALLESNKHLEKFAYSASHDLQEPLRKISTFSDSLSHRLQDQLEDKDAQYELERISDAAIRMREMIDGLLQLSRYALSEPLKKPYKLSELLTLLEDDLATPISESSTIINLINDATIWVDKSSFMQLMSNLVSNSIRYAQQDKPCQIEIATEESDDTIAITFSDNGQGFDEKFSTEIFEPFKRLVGRIIPGHGIGLAICKQIVLAHNGHIEASGTPNVGARFKVTIPKRSNVI